MHGHKRDCAVIFCTSTDPFDGRKPHPFESDGAKRPWRRCPTPNPWKPRRSWCPRSFRSRYAGPPPSASTRLLHHHAWPSAAPYAITAASATTTISPQSEWLDEAATETDEADASDAADATDKEPAQTEAAETGDAAAETGDAAAETGDEAAETGDEAAESGAAAESDVQDVDFLRVRETDVGDGVLLTIVSLPLPPAGVPGGRLRRQTFVFQRQLEELLYGATSGTYTGAIHRAIEVRATATPSVSATMPPIPWHHVHHPPFHPAA